MNMILAEAAEKATSWPDALMTLGFCAFGAFVFWCIVKY